MTDPPYSIAMRAYDDAPQDWLGIVERCNAAPGFIACFFMSPRFAVRFGSSLDSWNVERLLWWHKKADIGFPWRGWHMNSECVLICSRDGAVWPKNPPHRTDLYQTAPESVKPEHPCGKPVPVVADIVAHLSTIGDLILDPFAGSGTTAVACIRTGRRSISIEKEPKYCEIAKRRMEEAIGVGTLFDPNVIEQTLFAECVA